jgi:hypothetical protein
LAPRAALLVGTGSTAQTYVSNAPGASVVSKGIAGVISSAAVTVTISRGTDLPASTGVDRFSVTATLDTPNGTITVTAAGEALLVAGTWHLRGRTTITGGSWNVTDGSGGFTANIETGDPATMDDDARKPVAGTSGCDVAALVALENRFDVTVSDNATLIEPEHASAGFADLIQVVGDHHNRVGLALDLTDLFEALSAERSVANSECLVDQQNLRDP